MFSLCSAVHFAQSGPQSCSSLSHRSELPQTSFRTKVQFSRCVWSLTDKREHCPGSASPEPAALICEGMRGNEPLLPLSKVWFTVYFNMTTLWRSVQHWLTYLLLISCFLPRLSLSDSQRGVNWVFNLSPDRSLAYNPRKYGNSFPTDLGMMVL